MIDGWAWAGRVVLVGLVLSCGSGRDGGPEVCDGGQLDEEFAEAIESGGGSDFDSAGSLEALADATDGLVIGTVASWEARQMGDDLWGVMSIDVDDATLEVERIDVVHLLANVRDPDRFADGVGLRVVAFVYDPAEDEFAPSDEPGAWRASIEGLGIACDDTEPLTRIEAPLPVGEGEPTDPSINDLRTFLAED